MSDVKSVIISLCEVLSHVTELNIHAENLRLAKFNKNENRTVAVIWNVLHKLCCPSAYKETNGRCKGDGDVIDCVKSCLTSCHYDNFRFYSLPHDMSSGSRELLLALGWLLAETRILEIRILDYVKESLFNDYNHSGSTEKNYLPEASCDARLEVLSDKELCHHIMWVAGRIKQNLRAISSMTSENLDMLAKVQHVTKDAYNMPYLTVSQLSMLRDTQMWSSKKELVQAVKSVLEKYFHFIEHDVAFWAWMESVLVNDEEAFEGNKEDFNKYMEQLKDDVKDVILKDTSQDFNEIFDNMKLEFKSCAYSYNGNEFKKYVATVNERLDQMNNLYKSNISEINEYLQVVKNNCEGTK